jgi:glycosyltransferase involved in cell wall biosynthesis
MRIAVAASGLGHVTRGIETWAADLGRALASRGVAVTLCKGGDRPHADYERVIPCWQRAAAKTRRLLGCLPGRLGWRLGLGSDYQVEQTTFALNLLGLLRRERIDVLHVQDPLVAVWVQRARRLGLVRTRTILAHGTEEPPDFQRRITYLQHLAPWHLEDSRAQGAWRPTWTAIPNFIDTETFAPGPSAELRAELGLPADALVVLTAAAIKRDHKRIDCLVEEFARLRRARPELPAYLVVAGGRETETEEVVALGQRLLGDHVRFLVRFPRSRMPELYRLADVFTLCSLKEMMPIALLEATASGLPCVVHHHPVMAWMTGAGGLPRDLAPAGALAEALAGLLADGGKRRALGRQARQHCLDQFSQDRVVDQVLAYYEFVLTHDRPRAAGAGRVRTAPEIYARRQVLAWPEAGS